MVTIRRYAPQDEAQLFAMLEREGEEWALSWKGDGFKNYKRCLANCIVYVAVEGDELCGFARCRDDDGYGVYVYDLLVSPLHRGKSYGRLMMEQACIDFPESVVYVMSDVDEYYKKQCYPREGSIFIVKR